MPRGLPPIDVKCGMRSASGNETTQKSIVAYFAPKISLTFSPVWNGSKG